MRHSAGVFTKQKRLVRFRIGLGVAVIVVIVATVGAVTWATLRNTRTAIVKLTHERIQALINDLGDRVTTHMMSAVPAVELSRLLVRDRLVQTDRSALARQFVEVLRANPSFSWVSYSDESGKFTGTYRTESGEMHVSESDVQSSGKGELRERVVRESGAWTPSLLERDYAYDPRRDAFYVEARKVRERVWVGPYLFYDEGVPGITCASPHFDEDGRLLGVFTVDFNLNNLSHFVAELKFSAHGRVFVLAEDGSVIAHPALRIPEARITESKGKLITAADIGDPVLESFVAARQAAERVGSAGSQFSFEHAGERYLAGDDIVEIDGRLKWVVGAFAPESDFMGVLDQNRRSALLIMIVTLGLGVLLTAALARRISAPLVRLASEMEEIGKFQVADRPTMSTIFKEVALMDGALLKMKGGLRSFSYYVPRDLVRAVLASGQESKLRGETREITVYFSDIAGFTTAAETMTPEQLVDHLSRYLDEMTRVIAACGGTIDKFIGDAIMAFWGAPARSADHAARACEAALRCERTLADLRASAGTAWLAGLHARIGIATGDVLVGNIGTPERFNYTVMGDTVNLASRLEGLNKVYGTTILASAPAYEAARETVIGRPLDIVQVKGKQRGVRVYELLSLVSDGDSGTARERASLSESGMESYAARDFQGAVKWFEQALSIQPADAPAKLFIERCRHFMESPPPENWDGVYGATQK